MTVLASLLVLLVATSSAKEAGEVKEAHVVVYDGWGTPTSFRVTGRLLERSQPQESDKTASAARNFVDNFHALESDEIAGAELKIDIAGHSWAATTDVGGNFEVIAKNLPAAQALALGRIPVVVSVVQPARYLGQQGRGEIFVHADEASLGLISDIDDTVVQTFVTDPKRMIALELLKNAAQLEPVVGAAKNYREAQSARPLAFFYVSGSPQNLYPRLHQFLEDNDFPLGPMSLKNLGKTSLFAGDTYKLKSIEKIFAAFPNMRFVLVGDSGERDPEIYQQLRGRHPDRVVAIVIRKVAGSKHLEPERFSGCTVIDDAYAADDVIARLIASAVGAATGSAPLP